MFYEIKAITGLSDFRRAMQKIREHRVEIIGVTESMKEATLFFDEEFHEIPACKSKVVQDVTGVGDVFIGTFLAEHVQGKDPVWCAYVGSVAASFIVEGLGPAVFGEKRRNL